MSKDSSGDIQERCWELVEQFVAYYKARFLEFVGFYEFENMEAVVRACNDNTAPRRVIHYYKDGYLPLISFRRENFRFQLIDVERLSRVIKICQDAMDNEITEDSDIRVAILFSSQDFIQRTSEHGMMIALD